LSPKWPDDDALIAARQLSGRPITIVRIQEELEMLEARDDEAT
jgi:hypothetical protein